ncbi:MAG: 50S ribosomal protein L21 [Acidobacteria bacterium]|nr:50S ribosomal protein L21 [Acidobacteriota bacterium]
MNYAIVEIGGTQHRVAPGDTIKVQRLAAEAGGNITLQKVLLVQSGETMKVGAPYVAGAEVTATVLGEKKARKILVFKKKRRKQYRRLNGHRQILTSLQIQEIRSGS